MDVPNLIDKQYGSGIGNVHLRAAFSNGKGRFNLVSVPMIIWPDAGVL